MLEFLTSGLSAVVQRPSSSTRLVAEPGLRFGPAPAFLPGSQSQPEPSPPQPAVAVAEPEPAELKPREFDTGFADEYLALADELGVDAHELKREAYTARAETTIAALGLCVYDRQQVAAYLTSKYGVERTVKPDPRRGEGEMKLATWGWRPLRRTDRRDQSFVEPPRRERRNFVFAVSSSMSWVGNGTDENDSVLHPYSPYTKPVPIPVLLTVKDVLAKHPNAKFYVSDEISEQEATAIRDPFLMAVIDGATFIIERWDEPNYRER